MHPILQKKVAGIIKNNAAQVEGIFNIQEARNNLVEYLNKKSYEISEKDLAQKAEPGNRELLTFFDGYKHISDYYKIHFQFKIKFVGSDVEVLVDGKKKIMQKGTAQMVISTFIHEDYLEKKHGGFSTFYINLYNKFHGEQMFTDALMVAAIDAGQIMKYFRQQVGAKIY